MSMLGGPDAKRLKGAMQRAFKRVLAVPREVPRTMSLVLVWVGGAAMLVCCALLVYLAAVLLARLATWSFFS